ncbi:PTS sugar transporter subunit IIA [Helcococcus kunzii]|uniref:PTS system, mannose/fructose/sorbose family, IIA component n=1 Tax=Helcococcus kunzii ATCC 51366 TaxID=883114 RepID=H3NQS1_9FIRM|nr:PTS sugar transporter subunit IIA [Helcococcus kunzii]EHR32068.1 PTS system, mannose/fructose/sorbose family, IIA component [Helcococcus kunzii ATCC 51366]QUY65534.1 PTS sugar transporter subunit IIA [Helcococcus kunzii]
MKLLLLSHGSFGEGIKESYRMIAGDDSNILTISLTDEGIGIFTEKVESLLDELTKDNRVLVFTDMKGGTPFNVALKYQLEHSNKVELVAGMNLPMVLEIGMQISSEENLNKLSIEAVEIGKSGIFRSDIPDENIDDDFEI